MVAGEGDGLGSESFRHRLGAAMGQLALRFGPGDDNDARRGSPQGINVGLLMEVRHQVLPQQHVVPGTVVLRGQAEHRRICRLVGEVGRYRPLVPHDCDELRHPRAEAVPLVGLIDVPDRGERLLPIGKQLGERLARGQQGFAPAQDAEQPGPERW